MSLRATAMKSVRWTALSTASGFGSRFVVMLVAARILAPYEIGLYAIVNLVLGFASIFAVGGLTQGIIAKQDVSPDQLSSLFWLNLLLNIVICIVVALSAPALAAYYGQPRLFGLLVVAALVFLVNPVGQISQALLRMDLRFPALGRIDLTANLVNCLCAVALLHMGVGIYSLIAAQLIATALRGVLARSCCHDLMPIRFKFRYEEIRSIVRFGVFQTGTGLVNFASNRVDQMLIGGLLGPQALGYYSLAWTLVVDPVYRISPIITSVAFPVFARRQNDRGALTRGFHLATKLLTTAIAPLLFGFAAIAPNAIPFFLGDRWTPSVRLVELLSIVAITRMINNPVGSLVLAINRADKAFYWTLSYCIVHAPIYGAVLALGGLVPATAFLCTSNAAAVLLVYIYLLRPALGLMFSDHLKTFLPAVGLALGMAILVRATAMLPIQSTVALVAVQVTLGAAIYGGATLLLRRADVRQFAGLMTTRA
jgi:O-antigen/teichoic acid export membrane protein